MTEHPARGGGGGRLYSENWWGCTFPYNSQCPISVQKIILIFRILFQTQLKFVIYMFMYLNLLWNHFFVFTSLQSWSVFFLSCEFDNVNKPGQSHDNFIPNLKLKRQKLRVCPQLNRPFILQSEKKNYIVLLYGDYGYPVLPPTQQCLSSRSGWENQYSCAIKMTFWHS